MKDSILANKALSLTIESTHVKEFGKFFGSWNAESRGKFLLVESRIQLSSGNSESC